MPNMLMMRYAGSRGNENRDENRNEMRGSESRNEMRQGGNRNEMNGNMGGEMRGGNRNEMAYGMGDEMRRGNENAYDRGMAFPGGRETRSEYEGGAESRYRGRDGRWKSGRRRSEYEGGSSMAMEDEEKDMRQNRQRNGGEMRQYDRRRSGGDDDEDEKEYEVKVKPSNIIEWPYGQPEERQDNYRTNRQIGFGAQDSMERQGGKSRDDYSMGQGAGEMYGMMEFDRKTAEKWVRSMQNEDKAHPIGGKWTAEQLKPLAQKYGIPTDGKHFWEFFAMTNAMYSDYGEVARKFGITSPEFYVCMAKAWMDDKDAEKDKTALYYEYIVKKDQMGSAA